MADRPGGEDERLAPVIPLFAAAAAAAPGRAAERAQRPSPVDERAQRPSPVVERAQRVETTAAHGESPAKDSPRQEQPTPGWHTTWADLPAEDGPPSPARMHAEQVLLKKLRTRQLSASEARAAARAADAADDEADAIVHDLVRRGILDDAALADQLVRAGSERKGQGRQAIARTLATRGIPAELAVAALATLPDDDAERALEFARAKARSLRTVPADAALRRLAGQLARRGYPGPVALNAARTALDEQP